MYDCLIFSLLTSNASFVSMVYILLCPTNQQMIEPTVSYRADRISCPSGSVISPKAGKLKLLGIVTSASADSYFLSFYFVTFINFYIMQIYLNKKIC